MAAVPQRRHDPGRTLAQMILALADGATCLSDLAAIRSQSSMFGAGRVGGNGVENVQPDRLGRTPRHRRSTSGARERAWSAGAGPAGDDLIIDFDATLINTKADKQDARPNYKRGYGHHPLLAIIAETDEVLTREVAAGQRRVEHRGRSRHRAR